MKRDPRLVPLSREHHAALRLGRQLIAGEGGGLLRDMLPALRAHFAEEEHTLLPRLAAHGLDALVKRLRDEHAQLLALFAAAQRGERQAEAGQMLIDHVRFEERTLCPAVELLLEDAHP